MTSHVSNSHFPATAASLPLTAPTHDIWSKAQKLKLDPDQESRWHEILNQTCTYQPKPFVDPIHFSFIDFLNYFSQGVNTTFPTISVKGFLAGGAATHIITETDYSDINLRVFLSSPDPLPHIRNIIYSFIVQKVTEIYSGKVDPSTFEALITNYSCKSILKTNQTTSFAWFGMGNIDVKCFYTTDPKAHTLSNQEALMVCVNEPFLAYPYKEGAKGSLYESLDLIKSKRWAPNFEKQPQKYLEMTLHRLTQGLSIESFETLQPYLLSEIQHALKPTNNWFTEKYLPFLSRHYPVGTPLENKQIFSLLNTLSLLKQLDPNSQNASITNLKQTLASHIHNVRLHSPKFMQPFIKRLSTSGIDLSPEIFYRELLFLQAGFLRKALEKKDTEVNFSNPFLLIKMNSIQVSLFLESGLKSTIEQWAKEYLPLKNSFDDSWYKDSALTPTSPNVFFEEVLGCFFRYQFNLALAKPHTVSENLPKLFDIILNLKKQITTLSTDEDNDLNQAINRLFIFYSSQVQLKPLESKIPHDIDKYFKSFEVNSPQLQHFLELSIKTPALSKIGLYNVVYKSFFDLLENQKPIPPHIIAYLLENEELFKTHFVLTPENLKKSLSSLDLIPKNFQDKLFIQLLTLYQELDRSASNIKIKLKALDLMSALFQVFSKKEEKEALFPTYVRLYQQDKKNKDDLSPILINFFEHFRGDDEVKKANQLLSSGQLNFILDFAQHNKLFRNKCFYDGVAFLFEQSVSHPSSLSPNTFINFLKQSPEFWLESFPCLSSNPISKTTPTASLRNKKWIYQTALVQYRKIIEKGTTSEALVALEAQYDLEFTLLNKQNKRQKLQDILLLQQKWTDEETTQVLFDQTQHLLSTINEDDLPLIQQSLTQLLETPSWKERSKPLLLTACFESAQLKHPQNSLQFLLNWFETSHTNPSQIPLETIEKILEVQSSIFKSNKTLEIDEPFRKKLCLLNTCLIETLLLSQTPFPLERFNTLFSFLDELTKVVSEKSDLEGIQRAFLNTVLRHEPAQSALFIDESNPWLDLELLEDSKTIAPHLTCWLDQQKPPIQKSVTSLIKYLEKKVFLNELDNSDWLLPILVKSYTQNNKSFEDILVQSLEYTQDEFTRAHWETFYTHVMLHIPKEQLFKIGRPLLNFLLSLNEKKYLEALPEEQALTLLSPLTHYFEHIDDPNDQEVNQLLLLLSSSYFHPSVLEILENFLVNSFVDFTSHVEEISTLHKALPTNPFIQYTYLVTVEDIEVKNSIMLSPEGLEAKKHYSRLPLDVQRESHILYFHLFLDQTCNKLVNSELNAKDILEKTLPRFQEEIEAIKSTPFLMQDPSFKKDCFEYELQVPILQSYCENDIETMNQLILEFSLRLKKKETTLSTDSNALNLLKLLVFNFPMKKNGKAINLKLLTSFIKAASTELASFNSSDLKFMTLLTQLATCILHESNQLDDPKQYEANKELTFKLIMYFLDQQPYDLEDEFLNLEKTRLFDLVKKEYIFTQPQKIFDFLGSGNAYFLDMEIINELEQAGILYATSLQNGLYITPFKFELIEFAKTILDSLHTIKVELLASSSDSIPEDFNPLSVLTQISSYVGNKAEKSKQNLQERFNIPLFINLINSSTDLFVTGVLEDMQKAFSNLPLRSKKPSLSASENIEHNFEDCNLLLQKIIQFCFKDDAQSILKASSTFQYFISQTLKISANDPEVLCRRLPRFIQTYESFSPDLSLHVTPLMTSLFIQLQNKAVVSKKTDQEMIEGDSFQDLEFEARLSKRKSSLIKHFIETKYNLSALIEISYLLSLQSAILTFDSEIPQSTALMWEIFQSSIEGFNIFVASEHTTPNPVSKELKPMYEFIFSLWSKLQGNKGVNKKSPEFKEVDKKLNELYLLLKRKGLKISKKITFKPIVVLPGSL